MQYLELTCFLIFLFLISCFIVGFIFHARKHFKKQEIYNNLTEWQDIPEFESTEDIEIYLKNKSDNIEIENQKLAEKNRVRYYNKDFANFLYKKYGAKTFTNYNDNPNCAVWDYYEREFKKLEKNNELLPLRKLEILHDEKIKRLENFNFMMDKLEKWN